jgi:hypothetical protein
VRKSGPRSGLRWRPFPMSKKLETEKESRMRDRVARFADADEETVAMFAEEISQAVVAAFREVLREIAKVETTN